MEDFNADFRLAMLAARHMDLLVGAAVKTNMKLVADRFDDADAAGRRDRWHQGNYRRVRFLDALNKDVERVSTAMIIGHGIVRLLILDDTYVAHVARLPRGGLATLDKHLRIPAIIRLAIYGISSHSNLSDFAITQLAFEKFELEPTVMPVVPPISHYQPLVLLYEPVEGLLGALHLAEHTRSGIGAIVSLRVPMGLPTTDTHQNPPTPSPKRRYNDSEGDSEQPTSGTS